MRLSPVVESKCSHVLQNTVMSLFNASQKKYSLIVFVVDSKPLYLLLHELETAFFPFLGY